MTRWEHATEINDLAGELGVGGRAPVVGILDHCQRRIDGWVAEAGGVDGIDALELLVTRRLQMVFEEVRTDDDWDRLKDVYARGKKEFVFGGIRTKFEDDANQTYGALVQCRNAGADAPDRYVAVIDCRGFKLARRFFTRWHEIAHRLTTHADCGATEPGYRSEHDPIERMMDEIAGHVGFYGPIFDPVFQAAHGDETLLTFGTVQTVIDGGFADASFQATLNACIRKITRPVIFLEAAMGHKAAVMKEIEDESPRLFAFEPPTPDLRAVRSVANEAAKAEKFVIPQNMRVPESSVIRSVFERDLRSSSACREDLRLWSDSRGKRLEARTVAVEARKVGDRVLAIVQPVEPAHPGPVRPQTRGLFGE